MTNDEIKKLHIIQTKNVKHLKKAMRNLTSLEAFLDKSKNWTVEKRIEGIKRKYNNRPEKV